MTYQYPDIQSVQLGHIDVKDINDVKVIDEFVQRRARMANIDLANAEIHIDEVTGCVTAKTKLPKAMAKKTD